MAKNGISGIWKPKGITHYALNTILAPGGFTRSTKTLKEDAIAFLERAGNSAITLLWDYTPHLPQQVSPLSRNEPLMREMSKIYIPA